ncbi:MAG: flavin-containing monooxygenase [Alphaproteobacteria bacterium]
MDNHFDVIVIGAGISGIGAGYHLQTKCPEKSYAILEGRDTIGGTWDLFKYPGIRSDSDMYTLGFSFFPWKEKEAIADGPSILKYLDETSKKFNIDKKIKFNHYVKDASWCSEKSIWTLKVEDKNLMDTVTISCNFIFMCSGYYSYEKGYTPDFDGINEFNGKIMHPQKWDTSIDYSDKEVIVIGSGATAVTLVPEMAKKAKHVTMLQRSPTYVVSAPQQDPLAIFLQKYLPSKLSYFIVRWKNILRQQWYFRLCKKNPKRVKDFIINQVRKSLDHDYDVNKHFTPNYNPWDQRMCLVPNGDLFKSIRKKQTSVVTDTINKFTATGIKLESGKTLAADLIVTATGLNLEICSNINLKVDGRDINLPDTVTYKGMMFSGVPNLVSTFGYTNASWTLGADLTSEYVCRLLNYMKKSSIKKCCPEANSKIENNDDWLNLTSGYIKRSKDIFPKQGNRSPWTNNQNFLKDIFQIRYGKINDGEIKFS